MRAYRKTIHQVVLNSCSDRIKLDSRVRLFLFFKAELLLQV
jgi:hypothetical protein